LYVGPLFWYDLTMDASTHFEPLEFREAFFRQHPSAKSVMDLFAFLPSVYFYAKDSEHRYVGVNRPTLTEVFGLSDEKDLLGRTDAEFQPPALAEAYHAEDRRVMTSGQPIPNQVWLVPHVRGTPRWYVSSKAPLFSRENSVIGIAGVMYRIDTPDEEASQFQELRPVVNYIDEHYTGDLSMAEMAAMAKLSATHFNKRFQTVLRMSPTEYLLSLRVQHARRLLIESSKSISEIAASVGFYDQSHFTKRFRRVTGMTPLAYRKRFR
jgi:AraC-like DNA-binding protein